MNTRLLFVFILLLVFKTAIAQGSYPNVINPDPVSQEFQKYLGYPVSHATGIPQINIPIYTMNTSGISIPFNLNYHASGIKIEQEMGHIGLGWSLFPGFKISRIIMGKPDDIYPTNDIRDLDASFSQYEVIRSTSGGTIFPQPYFEYLYNITPHNMYDPMFGSDLSGTERTDAQHDIFTLHLPNRNVTFIVEWINGTIQTTTIPESPIKIDLVGLVSEGRFDSFEVTDESGIVYTFGNSGESNYYEFKDSHDGATTSWLLKTINPPGVNNSITFNYNETFNKMQNTRNLFVINFADEIIIDSNVGGTVYQTYPEYSTEMNYPDTYAVTTLDNIKYQTGESIDFTYSTIAGYMYDILENITFKNKNNTVIKTADFEHANKQLTKLTVSGEGAYEFAYDTQSVAPPAGKYTGSDFLGLFNGKYRAFPGIPEMNLYYNHHGTSPTYSDYTIGDESAKSHPVKAQARILKNIIYPTGGQTSFEYEPNFYQTLDEGVVSGMGLRIKEIDTYDPVSNKVLTKSYKYGKNEDGIGHCTIPNFDISTGQGATSYTSPYADAYVKQHYFGTLFGPGTKRTRTVSSTAKTGVISDPVIWYDEVIEYNDSSGGKTIFNYEFTPTEYFDYRDLPVVNGGMAEPTVPANFFPTVLRNVGNSAPRLVKQEIKDSNDNTLQVMEHTYSTSLADKRNIQGIYSRTLASGETSLIFPILQPGSSYYIYFGGPFGRKFLKADEYELEINNQKVISTTQTDYSGGGEIVTQTDYDYYDTYKFNLKSKTTTTSDGGTITEKYYYSVGDAIPDLSSLTTNQISAVNTFAANKNYHGRIIEKEVYKNSILLSAELYGYKDWGNTIYKLENVYTKKGSSSFKSLYTVEDYDNKGNILDLSKEDGSHISYIWGYDKQYPIAKIDNASYSDIASALNISTTDLKMYNESNLSSINGLRANSSMQNSMISTYIYTPLVGITNITDPKNYTVNYYYDTDYRLEIIKDDEGKIINNYEYHYIPYGTYNPIAVPTYSGNLNSGGGETLIAPN